MSLVSEQNSSVESVSELPGVNFIMGLFVHGQVSAVSQDSHKKDTTAFFSLPFILLIEFHYSANNAFHSNALWPHLKFIICPVNISLLHTYETLLHQTACCLPRAPLHVLLNLHLPHICFSRRECWRGVMQRTCRQTPSPACQPLPFVSHPSVCHVNGFKCRHFASLSWRPKCHVLVLPPLRCRPRAM